MEEIKTLRLEEISCKVLEAINRLLSQLVTSKSIILSEVQLKEIILSASSEIFLMYRGHEIIGMFTIANYLTPTGRKYWLEDVVVDNRYRGQLLGKRMVEEAIRLVEERGKSTFMLTSKPVRVVANKLYSSLGFEKKETNVYKMDFI